jgi:hypothetical protein
MQMELRLTNCHHPPSAPPVSPLHSYQPPTLPHKTLSQTTTQIKGLGSRIAELSLLRLWLGVTMRLWWLVLLPATALVDCARGAVDPETRKNFTHSTYRKFWAVQAELRGVRCAVCVAVTVTGGRYCRTGEAAAVLWAAGSQAPPVRPSQKGTHYDAWSQGPPDLQLLTQFRCIFWENNFSDFECV